MELSGERKNNKNHPSTPIIISMISAVKERNSAMRVHGRNAISILKF